MTCSSFTSFFILSSKILRGKRETRKSEGSLPTILLCFSSSLMEAPNILGRSHIFSCSLKWPSSMMLSFTKITLNLITGTILATEFVLISSFDFFPLFFPFFFSRFSQSQTCPFSENSPRIFRVLSDFEERYFSSHSKVFILFYFILFYFFYFFF